MAVVKNFRLKANIHWKLIWSINNRIAVVFSVCGSGRMRICEILCMSYLVETF